MYEILDSLPDDALVLDLGSGGGSFRAEDYKFRTILVDSKLDHLPTGRNAVQAHGHVLPFRAKSFDAVILSHVLEHEENPKRMLPEVGGVLKRSGTAYVAVPDARTFSDRLYRKVFRNRGGHASLFASEEDLRATIAWYLGLPHEATRMPYSSFAYLNRRNFQDATERTQILLPPLPEILVVAITCLANKVDRWFLTRSRPSDARAAIETSCAITRSGCTTVQDVPSPFLR
jgi:SAM-dependent methyltransferase